MTRLVIIESPYAADNPAVVAANVAYLQACVRDCCMRGDSPYASHLMLTGALDDRDPGERAMGIALGLEWRRVADERIFYIGRGWSGGMLSACTLYEGQGFTYEIRDPDRVDGRLAHFDGVSRCGDPGWWRP